MADLTLPTDPKAALHTVCLYLAQSGEPHRDLGYATQMEAFEDIGSKFQVPKLSVRNVRDIFDRFSDSDRVGWENEALPERFNLIFEKFRGVTRADFQGAVKSILAQDWLEIDTADAEFDVFERVIAEAGAPTNVRPPVDGLSVEFSNTGIRSNGWFVLTLDQIHQTLEDLIANNEGIVAETGSPASYHEATWRRIFETQLSNEVASTMGKVQTLPLFELLAKIIHFSSSSTVRTFRKLILDRVDLETARDVVWNWKRSAGKDEGGESTEDLIDGAPTRKHITGGENAIFYGAPGTGKSNLVDRKIAGAVSFRTVFHPDLQNSDFFGCLKPQMDGDTVRYGFAPGPFMQALAAAYEEPDKPVYLVIEELNRAAAAAVFGDLFLLLDRDSDGSGEYDVSFPSPESQTWFEHEAGGPHKAICLPSNLFIYATMNSADQGVYPIDTAFRRRWRQEYLPLDYKSGPNGEVAYIDAIGKSHSLIWRDFIKLLNEHLINSHTLDIAEDRLLGQWFVKKYELDGTGIPEKVLLYLWDDLLRHEGRDLVFNTSEIKTYGALALETGRGGRFLSDQFLALLNAASEVEHEEVEVAKSSAE